MIDVSKVDCLIIGAGICGSIIARKLAENNKKVLIMERRNHIAGNLYDEMDDNGILVQRYGPHIFHTSSKEAYDFITKYHKWNDYHHQPAVEMDGVISPAPPDYTTIDLFYAGEEAENLKKHLEEKFAGQETVAILELINCDDPIIKKYGNKLYEANYKPYTAKQWGIAPEEIDPGIFKRVPVRLNYRKGYFNDSYVCMPENGFTDFFEKLLEHQNIEIQLNADANKLIKIDTDKKQIVYNGKPVNMPVVYTGAIDELLEYRYGELPYRSLRFEYRTENTDSFQEASVTAFPKAQGYTRITEFKKLPPQNVPGVTTIMYEYPMQANKDEGNEPYYPIINDNNTASYKKYLADLEGVSNLRLCGRLADYKYYDIDNAVMRALEVYKTVFEK